MNRAARSVSPSTPAANAPHTANQHWSLCAAVPQNRRPSQRSDSPSPRARRGQQEGAAEGRQRQSGGRRQMQRGAGAKGSSRSTTRGRERKRRLLTNAPSTLSLARRSPSRTHHQPPAPLHLPTAPAVKQVPAALAHRHPTAYLLHDAPTPPSPLASWTGPAASVVPSLPPRHPPPLHHPHWADQPLPFAGLADVAGCVLGH